MSSFWGPLHYARRNPPSQLREELNSVDVVLVSHNHWDHVDGKYFRMLDNTPVIAPKMTSWIIKLLGAQNIVSLAAWEGRGFGEIKITAVPAIHLTATIGYVIQSENQQIYFAGDTFYGSFMQVINQKFRLDVALMPVTTYRIPMTISEKEAVRAAQALKPNVVIPIHLGITPRSPILRTSQSPEGFAQRLKDSGLPTKMVYLQEGESYAI